MYENGYLESMISDKITLYRDEQGFNTELKTPSGSIIYGDNGKYEKINGAYETIMSEANAEYNKIEQAFINFDEYGIISNTGTSGNGNNVSINANQNGLDISDEKGTGVSANQNDVNISAGNGTGISANQNGVNIDLGGDKGITANQNGISINTGGLELNLGTGGVDVAVDNAKNTIIKYVLLGVAFLVAFIVLIFGIIKIKQKNGQVKMK